MKREGPPENFAIFILTHGRADHVITYKTLQKCGYTGKVYFIVDNEDDQLSKYVENFGRERVIVIDKKIIAEETDECDNFEKRNTVLYARNACQVIAAEIGVDYFLELDDDYTGFFYKAGKSLEYLNSNQSNMVKDLNAVINLLLTYYHNTPLVSLAIAQGGDFIGGEANEIHSSMTLRRKVMNTFFLSTRRPYQFIGRMNDDVNTYVRFGNIGHLFLTFPLLAIRQKPTQSQKGGLTEMYKDAGTYVKSFYTVMIAPSSVKVSIMGDKHKRIHHSIDWVHTVPMILPETVRKV